ncbi:MAG: hypothetical protein V4665_03470 [Patescibacteria group bacterium]
MENSFQTSFIPKKPITPVNPSSSRPNASRSLFSILATLLLVVAAVSAGGLYFYKSYLIRQKEVLSVSLERVRDTFEQDTITELELFDKRVAAAKQVLGGHIVLSPMFELLGALTIPSIQYTRFTHETTDQGFFVKMSGIARDYRSIALQADVFNSAKGRSFRNVVFSNLTRDKNNSVGFDVEFVVDPSLLSYEKNMAVGGAQVKTETAAPQAPVNQTPQAPETSETPLSSGSTTQQLPNGEISVPPLAETTAN